MDGTPEQGTWAASPQAGGRGPGEGGLEAGRAQEGREMVPTRFASLDFLPSMVPDHREPTPHLAFTGTVAWLLVPSP